MNEAISKYIDLSKQLSVNQLIHDLISIPTIQAIVLGGSFARGTQHAQSDIDLGIYYHENKPLDIQAIKQCMQQFATTQPVITQLYEWGRWVNGGAWIETSIGKIDILYRNIEQVQRVIADSQQGNFELDYEQQPPFGFYSVMYLAETYDCKVLYDPNNSIGHLKEQVVTYPESLRSSIIQKNVWSAEFTILNARKAAQQGDVLYVAGCIVRACAALNQAIFAFNRNYFASDKKTLDAIQGFNSKPIDYKVRVTELLANVGSTSEQLTTSVEKAALLCKEVADLVGDLYKPLY